MSVHSPRLRNKWMKIQVHPFVLTTNQGSGVGSTCFPSPLKLRLCNCQAHKHLESLTFLSAYIHRWEHASAMHQVSFWTLRNKRKITRRTYSLRAQSLAEEIAWKADHYASMCKGQIDRKSRYWRSPTVEAPREKGSNIRGNISTNLFEINRVLGNTCSLSRIIMWHWWWGPSSGKTSGLCGKGRRVKKQMEKEKAGVWRVAGRGRTCWGGGPRSGKRLSKRD